MAVVWKAWPRSGPTTYTVREVSDDECPAIGVVTVTVEPSVSQGVVRIGDADTEPGRVTTSRLTVAGLPRGAVVGLSATLPMAYAMAVDRGVLLSDGRGGRGVEVRVDGDGDYTISWLGLLSPLREVTVAATVAMSTSCGQPQVLPGTLRSTSCAIPMRAVRLLSGMGAVRLIDVQGRQVYASDGAVGDLDLADAVGGIDLAPGLYVLVTQWQGTRAVMVEPR